jgi:hypothetical protein
MAEERISEFTKVSSSGSGLDVDSRGLQMVVLWDIGPQKPVQPKRPEPPKGNVGEPAYELAVVEFRDVLDVYDKAIRAHRKAKADYEAWHAQWGGPYEFHNYWSSDATDALARDPKRYFVSASTRGYVGIANRGLPEGMSPGRGHHENMRRIAQGESDIATIRQTDPIFGKQELRE